MFRVVPAYMSDRIRSGVSAAGRAWDPPSPKGSLVQAKGTHSWDESTTTLVRVAVLDHAAALEATIVLELRTCSEHGCRLLCPVARRNQVVILCEIGRFRRHFGQQNSRLLTWFDPASTLA
jgi:hypothetical protein